jgi:thioester reductase-like protein
VVGYTGYAESKYVAEKILQAANERAAVSTSILCLGQIVGSRRIDTGTWNTSEALPMMLQASKILGVIPQSIPGYVDWLKVDTMAQVIMDIIRHAMKLHESCTYNLVNPHPIEWKELLPAIREAWELETLVPVSFDRWTQTLAQSIDENGHSPVPAADIIDYFEKITPLANTPSRKYRLENSIAASPVLKNTTAIDTDFMAAWLSKWRF